MAIGAAGAGPHAVGAPGTVGFDWEKDGPADARVTVATEPTADSLSQVHETGIARGVRQRARIRATIAARSPSPQIPEAALVDRFEPNLRIPGPTALPASVREAGARQMINHRGPEFAQMLARILEGMKPYFGTTNDIAMLSCAGSGGLEAAVVNTLSPGDRVLGVSIGSFGDRFAKIAETYGADVTKVEAEWGYAAAGEEVREVLAIGARDQGRPADPQRDVDRRHEPHRGAGRGRPLRGARGADPGRQRVRPRAPCRSRWTAGAWTWSSPARRRRGCPRRAWR